MPMRRTHAQGSSAQGDSRGDRSSDWKEFLGLDCGGGGAFCL